jgi:hypothetical protein
MMWGGGGCLRNRNKYEVILKKKSVKKLRLCRYFKNDVIKKRMIFFGAVKEYRIMEVKLHAVNLCTKLTCDNFHLCVG